MYRIFCRNTKNFFIINQAGEHENDFRLRIAYPIQGLIDIRLYEKWKNQNIELYEEVNNLVYEINNNKDKFHSFKTFSLELRGYGFKAIKSNKYKKSIVDEQLKLINLLLGTQYWVDLEEA